MPSPARQLITPALLLVLATPLPAAFHYAVEDKATGDIVRRGVQLETGIRSGEVILAPESAFRVWVYDSETKLLGFREFVTGGAGQVFSVDSVPLRHSASIDSDGDGLSNEAEMILGSDPNNPDTDGDGVSDGAALELGLDPVVGAITGVVGGVGAGGTALDVTARNDLAVVANGTDGIAIFNVFNGMTPIIMANVDTPGTAQSAALSGNFVAVADGTPGLAIIDVNDPAAASIIHQLPFGSPVVAVAASNGIAYGALASGEVVAVVMETGIVLQRTFVGLGLQDLALAGDHLYALSASALFSLPLTGNFFSPGGSSAAPATGTLSRRRLHAGSPLAYASHDGGYNVFSLATPNAPTLLNNVVPGTVDWKQIRANGSGLGVASYITPGFNVHTRTLSLDGLGDAYLGSFTAGGGYVEAVEIYNGIAYLAEGTSLTVLNYLSTDSAGTPPNITLQTTAVGGTAQEGQPFRVTAQVTDDVQVRNVEFYVDGARIATDGNHPFEHRFNAPLRTGGDDAFILQARASDTGGNATWTEEIPISLGPDTTGPLATVTIPGAGAIAGATETISVVFNEALNPSTLVDANLFLVSAGPDEAPGNSDDVTISASGMSLSPDGTLATLTFASPLAPGVYFVKVGPGLEDLAGNTAAPASLPSFRLTGDPDADGDGVPDAVELALGLDPLDPDSDDDGLPDGLEDNDGDGLGNAIEVVLGLDPTLPDTNGNGILDRDEDADLDSIDNFDEIAMGMNPLRVDSDGDEFWDEVELTLGSDPTNRHLRPALTVIASTQPSVLRPSAIELPADIQIGTVIASTRPSVIRPSATELPAGVTIGTVIAPERPSLVRPSTTELPADIQIGTVIASTRPSVIRPSATELPAGVTIGTVIAPERPSLVRPSTTELPADTEIGTVIATPPLELTRPTSP